MQTALIVDDEPYIRGWLDHFFQERGFQTSVCSGVTEALHELNTTCFDIVLTDYNMADGTGGTVLQTTKARCPNASRALMTGVLASVPDVHREMAHHLFEKPLSIGALHDLLEGLPVATLSAGTSQAASSRPSG